MTKALAQELSQTRLLQGATPALLDRIQAQSKVQDLPAGAILLSPERRNEHIYLLLSGSLSVHFGKADSPVISTLAAGDSVGEMSVIDDTTPTAYVIATEASRVFPIHRELLVKLVSENNPVAHNLLATMSQWLRENVKRIVDDRAQIGVLNSHVNIDGLTGIHNRRWFDNAQKRLLRQAHEQQQPLCLLLLDIDHFKQYNDRNGHAGGDQALRAMGQLLSTVIRPNDFSVRYGGEEFAVLLPATSADEALIVAERIRKAASELEIRDVHGLPLPGFTVSIGMAESKNQSTPESLIEEADKALYLAKGSGRNCVRR